ncbi:MAG: hypothetical protein ACP5E4_03075 [Candidatus Aenigmatarchaeota archaeon]
MKTVSLSRAEGYDPNLANTYQTVSTYRPLIKEAIETRRLRKIDRSLHIGRKRGGHIKQDLQRVNQAISSYGAKEIRPGDNLSDNQVAGLQRLLREAAAYNEAQHRKYA